MRPGFAKSREVRGQQETPIVWANRLCAQGPPCGGEEAWQGAWPWGGPYFVDGEDLQGVPGGQLQLDQFLIPCFNRL